MSGQKLTPLPLHKDFHSPKNSHSSQEQSVKNFFLIFTHYPNTIACASIYRPQNKRNSKDKHAPKAYIGLLPQVRVKKGEMHK
ncbi:hypothetical protein KFK09_018112 [Dendrobium nobile]|uniref:Uncharacterized protein n=1 Tax=Dendrobium nobile TaxID=94219 RepID=A0A8T3AV20_DENNO|nr:hypothetical protein KFK09_018112 [Dendrobium nobile]